MEISLILSADSHGNFQLRTRSEAEQIKKTREELKKERLALKVQGSSILEREAKKGGQDQTSWSNENTNNNFEMGPMIQGNERTAFNQWTIKVLMLRMLNCSFNLFIQLSIPPVIPLTSVPSACPHLPHLQTFRPSKFTIRHSPIHLRSLEIFCQCLIECLLNIRRKTRKRNSLLIYQKYARAWVGG